MSNLRIVKILLIVSIFVTGNPAFTQQNSFPSKDITVFGLIISPPNVTTLNFDLTAPQMNITPAFLVVNLTQGETGDQTITIQNTGDDTLIWNATLREQNKRISVPKSDGRFPRGTAAPSIGRAPRGGKVIPAAPIITKGSLGYAINIYPGETFFSFNTDDPGNVTGIGSTSGYLPFGGTFDAENNDFMYFVDYERNTLNKIYLATGAIETIGSCMTTGGEFWTGISVDKNTNLMYGISTNLSQSTIYTIDMATGVATPLFTTIIPGAIDIAIDENGIPWVPDIVNDALYSVNLATGDATAVGWMGFDANYAQGAGYDFETNTLFLAAYNNDGSSGQLRIADRTTGNTVLVGSFPGGCEVDCLAFPGNGRPKWISIDPDNGIIPGGSSMNMNVHLDATNLPHDFYDATITFTSTPDPDTTVVPVSLTVFPAGILWIEQLLGVQSGPVSVPVHASGITDMGSFRFSIDYDAAHLTYVGTSNWYQGITDILVSNPSAGMLTFVWADSTGGLTIPEETFFNFDFTFDGSPQAAIIAWSDNPIPREFVHSNGSTFLPAYYDGFVANSIGVPETGGQSIAIFPNPANDLLNVRSDFSIRSIEIFSFLGQKVCTKSNIEAQNAQIEVSSLASGIYFVKMDTGQGLKTMKVTVKH